MKQKTNAKSKVSALIMPQVIVILKFNVWLIEVNTNPCIEESSDLLKMLLPRRLHDAFKLTIDITFPLLVQYMTNPINKYPVTVYQDDCNMW